LSDRAATRIFCGNGVSPGLAAGKALKLDSHFRFVLKAYVGEGELDCQVSRFRRAVKQSREQLESLRAQLEQKVGKEHSFILDAHMLMLEDPSFLAEIDALIRENHANAEWAIQDAAERIRRAYSALDDEYFRERGRDFEYVAQRLLSNLTGSNQFSWSSLPDDLIIVAHDLSPSAFAVMDLQKVRGLALESGGRSSHTAILARRLQIPTVMELHDFVSAVNSGDPIVLKADEGRVVLWPSEECLESARRRLEASAAVGEPAFTGETAAVSEDGVAVSLRANTELPHEVVVAKRCGAEGIGLFRSEFIFFAHPQGPPDRESQFEIYGMLAREMSPHPVAVRTLDTGVGRLVTRSDFASEPNPSMGLRGIRLSFAEPALFVTQIEAILQASSLGRLEIVIPMVSTVEEVWEAKRIIAKVASGMQKSLDFDTGRVPLGVMIEVPAAVLTLDSIVREVDFICVGTNDLVQYLLAADRDNPQVAHLFQPLHPSVLQCLHRIARISLQYGKPARICGEVSSNPFFAVLLLGMGYRLLSMNPLSIPQIREVVRRVRIKDAEALVEKVLSMYTVQDISTFLVDALPPLLGLDLSPHAADLSRKVVRDRIQPV